MAWQGIWFDPEARAGGARDPESFQSLLPPIVYPWVHSFVEAEQERVRRSLDPGTIVVDGERHRVYYALVHDGHETELDAQGCRVLRWLFEHFDPDDPKALAARFSEIPVLLHGEHPGKAAAMANALTLVRFLTAEEDQAVAKICVQPMEVSRLGPARAVAYWEEQARAFLGGSVFYPEDVSVFEVLGRSDLRGHRELPACCFTQIGFLRSLLDWIDEEGWPGNAESARSLEGRLRKSLVDEARFLREEALAARAEAERRLHEE